MRKSILICCLFIAPLFASAQYFELGLMAGISNYQGDLGPSNLKTSLGRTHAAFGGFARYNVNDYISGRVSLNYATISGDDALYDRKRNLNFKSGLIGLEVTGEFNILGYQPYALQRIFSPYIFVGIGMTHFNPRTQYEGEWVQLQPLGTEGQGLAGNPGTYSLVTFTVPFGGGLKYAINDTWNIGIEMGLRMVFTDYLDDVSGDYADIDQILAERGEVAAALSNRSGIEYEEGFPRGNPANNDWYLITGITVSYNFIDNGLVGFRSKSRRKSGCPTF